MVLSSLSNYFFVLTALFTSSSKACSALYASFFACFKAETATCSVTTSPFAILLQIVAMKEYNTWLVKPQTIPVSQQKAYPTKVSSQLAKKPIPIGINIITVFTFCLVTSLRIFDVTNLLKGYLRICVATTIPTITP